MRRRRGALIAILALSFPGTAAAQLATVRDFEVPKRTTWQPDGCRTVETRDPVLGDRTFWRNLHGDAVNSDEVATAVAPTLELDWVAETGMYFPSAATTDRDGHVYASPLWPEEEVILVSLDAEDGSRRWAIPGSAAGAGSPFVLEDPEHHGREIIYLGKYDEVVAVRPDGTLLWRKPTGLTPPTGREREVPFLSFGQNYHSAADALVGVTGDGFIWAVDRKTGEQVLEEPYALPGSPTPPAPLVLPPPVAATWEAELLPLMGGRPASQGTQEIADVLLGNDIEVANFFSIDPNSRRMWVASTAPDEADGTTDGISEFGALYAFDLVVDGGPPYRVEEQCRVLFDGGSASTPALRQDGSRVYLGDAEGRLLAIDPDCTEVWQVDLGAQIVGSVGVAADRGELYIISGRDMVKVVDEGDSGRIEWRSALDMYELPPGQAAFNLLTPGIGANGVFLHGGAGVTALRPDGSESVRPFVVGVGVMDRETGTMRAYTEGPEESVATSGIGPDGSFILSHSPIRRALGRAIAEITPGLAGLTSPLIGGVARYAPARLDLLIRDAVCAASDRALNAYETRHECRDSARSDRRQMRQLIAQASRANDEALGSGEISQIEHRTVARWLLGALARPFLGQLDTAAATLGAACGFLPTRPVPIDVIPGEDGNVVNLLRPGEPIPVALLGSGDLDIASLDLAAVRLGPFRAEPIEDVTDPAVLDSLFSDVNGDGFDDVVLSFVTARTGLFLGSSEACLVGADHVACDEVDVRFGGSR